MPSIGRPKGISSSVSPPDSLPHTPASWLELRRLYTSEDAHAVPGRLRATAPNASCPGPAVASAARAGREARRRRAPACCERLRCRPDARLLCPAAALHAHFPADCSTHRSAQRGCSCASTPHSVETHCFDGSTKRPIKQLGMPCALRARAPLRRRVECAPALSGRTHSRRRPSREPLAPLSTSLPKEMNPLQLVQHVPRTPQ